MWHDPLLHLCLLMVAFPLSAPILMYIDARKNARLSAFLGQTGSIKVWMAGIKRKVEGQLRGRAVSLRSDYIRGKPIETGVRVALFDRGEAFRFEPRGLFGRLILRLRSRSLDPLRRRFKIVDESGGSGFEREDFRAALKALSRVRAFKEARVGEASVELVFAARWSSFRRVRSWIELAVGLAEALDLKIEPVAAPSAEGLLCPFCRDGVSEGEARSCGDCGTRHHEECYAEAGGCTVFGCASRPTRERVRT